MSTLDADPIPPSFTLRITVLTRLLVVVVPTPPYYPVKVHCEWEDTFYNMNDNRYEAVPFVQLPQMRRFLRRMQSASHLE